MAKQRTVEHFINKLTGLMNGKWKENSFINGKWVASDKELHSVLQDVSPADCLFTTDITPETFFDIMEKEGIEQDKNGPQYDNIYQYRYAIGGREIKIVYRVKTKSVSIWF